MVSRWILMVRVPSPHDGLRTSAPPHQHTGTTSLQSSSNHQKPSKIINSIKIVMIPIGLNKYTDTWNVLIHRSETLHPTMSSARTIPNHRDFIGNYQKYASLDDPNQMRDDPSDPVSRKSDPRESTNRVHPRGQPIQRIEKLHDP